MRAGCGMYARGVECTRVVGNVRAGWKMCARCGGMYPRGGEFARGVVNVRAG